MESFQLKQFAIVQSRAALKIGTDAMLLGSWTNVNPNARILDVGTGTGIIALLLAQRYSDTRITGLEPDPGSFLDAVQNFSNAPWSSRLTAENQTIQDFLKACPQASFDHIVSNPPYFSSPGKGAITRKLNARHTVNLTHEELMKLSLQLLQEHGKLSLILPSKAGEECLAFASKWIPLGERQGLYCHRICRVRSKADKPITRYLIEWGLTPVEPEESELIVMDGKGPKGYAPEFCKLTEAFYPFM